MSKRAKSGTGADLSPTHDPKDEHEQDMTSATLGDETNEKLDANPADPEDRPYGGETVTAESGVEVEDPQAIRKVEIVHNQTIVNGHCLVEGAVVEMSNFMIEAHRSRGVPLIDVEDDDDREVIDVSEPFVAQEGA